MSGRAVIGQDIKIKGTDLLCVSGQLKPTVDFTSVGGSTISAVIVSITGSLMVVQVPNGAASGPITIGWPGEIEVTDSSVTVT